MKTINNTSTGAKIPVTVDLQIKPLVYEGEEIFRKDGSKVMDNEWIYVSTSTGPKSINVNRAKYCEMIYLSKVTVKESIGENKKMSKDLQKLVERFGTLVFNYCGRNYRVFLKKETNRTFGIARIAKYRWIYEPNEMCSGVHAHALSLPLSFFYL